MEESLPPGFRFHPTDEELVTYYLVNKVSDVDFTTRAVADVDLNKSEPWDLPGKASMGENEWYFFSLRDRKYPTGLRTNRATEAGYWKTTGKDKEVIRGSIVVGMKKTLVFYRGRAPKGEKTNWVMHEYRLENKVSFEPTKGEWVVCRVFEKTPKKSHQQMASRDDIDLTSLTNANDFEGDNNINMTQQLQNYSTTMMNWPSSSSTSNNVSINSLLLTALQLRGHDDDQLRRSMDYSFMQQNVAPLQQGENRYFDNMPFDVDSNMW